MLPDEHCRVKNKVKDIELHSFSLFTAVITLCCESAAASD